MPFSKEDKIIIKLYRLNKGYGRKKLLNEFPGKYWSAGGLDKLLHKIDETQSVERKAGSGRPRTGRTGENIEIVEELICSQEDEPKSHKTPREIARETGISHSSVRRIAKFDLNLTPFKRVKGQKLSAKDEEKRKKRAAKLLRIVLKRSLKKTFFTDEKIFTVDTPRNTQNDRVYADATKKNEISDERLYTTKSTEEDHGFSWYFTTWKNIFVCFRARSKGERAILPRRTFSKDDSRNGCHIRW